MPRISSKSLGSGTACPNLSPSSRVCHHSTDVTSCVSLESGTCNSEYNFARVLRLFAVCNRPECKYLVKDVFADGHCSFRAIASASEHNE